MTGSNRAARWSIVLLCFSSVSGVTTAICWPTFVREEAEQEGHYVYEGDNWQTIYAESQTGLREAAWSGENPETIPAATVYVGYEQEDQVSFTLYDETDGASLELDVQDPRLATRYRYGPDGVTVALTPSGETDLKSAAYYDFDADGHLDAAQFEPREGEVEQRILVGDEWKVANTEDQDVWRVEGPDGQKRDVVFSDGAWQFK